MPRAREQRRAGVDRDMAGGIRHRPRGEGAKAERAELVRAPVAERKELVVDPEDSDRLAVHVDDLAVAVREVGDLANDDPHARSAYSCSPCSSRIWTGSPAWTPSP